MAFKAARKSAIAILLVVLPAFLLLPNGVSVGSDYVDDGRYDYGLSQPQPFLKVKAEYDVLIPTRDGAYLHCDVYRPDAPGKYPVIMALAPYPRSLNFGAFSPYIGVDDNGGVGTQYWGFEQANPEYWIPRGYVYVTVSAKGYGGSDGISLPLTRQEAEDFYDAIEWAAMQPWSTGAIGLYGISYYAFSQYWVAGMKPPHLKAIVPWEWLAEPYRDIAFRGGIPCWFGVFFALGLRMLSNNFLIAPSFLLMMFFYPLYDDNWRQFTNPLLEEIEVPMLSVGCLNDPDLHLRGNVNAFAAARGPRKKLLLYSGTHWGSAYQPWANRTVLRFFDHYLKGVDTGIEEEPAVDVELRTGSHTFTHVYGNQWPLEQTQWTKFFLDAGTRSLSRTDNPNSAQAVAQWESDEFGTSQRVLFLSDPLPEDMSIAGPLAAHFWVSSTAGDVDLTVELHAYDENGEEIRFPYYLPDAADEPVSRGWLRASLRALDPERSRPYQPYHTFSKNEWLTPGVPVPVDVEIWPTSMLFRKGTRFGLTIHCGTYFRAGEATFGLELPFFGKWFLRSPVYQTLSPDAGTAAIHTGGPFSSWLYLPVIPPDPAPLRQAAITDAGYSPSHLEGQMGDRFQWENLGVDYHTVTECSGLGLWDSQLVNGSRSHNPETWWLKIPWAGTYRYRDMVSGFEGTLGITPNVRYATPPGNAVEVELGLEAPEEGTGFDVQLKTGGGDWVTVLEGTRETRISLTLPPGEHAVRCRLRRLGGDGAATEWSPPASFSIP